MPDIGFYHLTRSDAAASLPPLLARTLALGERALILCPNQATVSALDDSLWKPEWLPHGTAATPHPNLQPIYLTTTPENPANAAFLFLIDATGLPGLTPYKRVFDLFDGNAEDAVTAARTRWRAAKEAGHTLTYWRQTESGWEKAAS
jgi:DNA polymerase-3 subunit chi